MSNIVTVTVAKSTQSTSINAKAGIKFFTHTLQVMGESSELRTIPGPFGDQIVGGGAQILNTYYMYKQVSAAPIGLTVDLNLDDYDMIEEDFTTDNGKDIVLKKLFPRG